ncbi:centrosome-associated protein Alms1a-like [Anopheles cruzii]|uniref:centrosome-associated protein Alms1a-like n=1 Tax=Anopheles cruzii TaxID=68878 RepID=UPI0022EC1CF3|nr:centrosome-associated protein Alms1a-like [Anopheles cruzii]
MSQSDRVTDLIMHYYMQHGRNRDLEKYLRLRRMSNATRSSSDGSLPGLDELQRRTMGAGCAAERSGVGRSMENLSTLRKQAERQELAEGEQSLRNASGESAKSVAKSDAEQPPPATKGVTVREKKVEQKSGRNFNFNLESVIEINLPPPPTISIGPGLTSAVAPIAYGQLAGVQPMGAAADAGKEPSRLVVHENSTQTAGQEDAPIRPVVKPSVPAGNEDPLDSTKDLSPGSSIASNRQKLEWDSLGDIGYDSSERLQFCGAADLNETEKRCLQRYFARKGLTFDRSVVVVRHREGEKPRKVQPQDASIVLTNPGAQSTPKAVPEDAVKATQTTLHVNRALESRGIQVEAEVCGRSDGRVEKAVGTESLTMVSVDAAESFEFFPPSGPEMTSNGTTSASMPSSTTSSSCAAGGDGTSASLRPAFDDEVKLGLTLYNSIRELTSMPTGVKESLIDKIFRKLSRHDPERRTREQLLRDYAKAVRERPTVSDPVQDNVYDDVSSGDAVKDVPSPGSTQEDRSLDVVEIADETKDPAEGSANDVHPVSVGSVRGSSSESNDANNVPVVAIVSTSGELGSVEDSSQPETVGTAHEKVPENNNLSRDRRVRKAMQDYLRPMTHSEVEYENLKKLQQRNQQQRRAKEPQLAKIDREIEQLLVKKMMLLAAAQNSEQTVRSGGEEVHHRPPEAKANAVPSERSGTVYTSVHEPVSQGLDGRSSKDSSAWNSHYHMAKLIKTRSKLETPTSPSDVSIPTFIKQKQEQFIENYDQVRQRRAFEDQNHIYTRPYSGQRSEMHRHQQQKENCALGRSKHVTKKMPSAQARRTVESSSNNSVPSPMIDDGAAFISSDSISIPVVTTLTNTTTTHHYDIKSRRSTPVVSGRTAGTQTTDSIRRTKPIFGEQRSRKEKATSTVSVPGHHATAAVETYGHGKDDGRRPVECHCVCGCRARSADHAVPRRTELIDGTGGRQDKQAQTKPSSIAYIITFEGGAERAPAPRRDHPKFSERPVSVASTASTLESETAENGKDNVSEKMLTLREQFCRSCPAALTRIEERRRCIGELNKLRSKRNAQRQRLLLLTSDDSLRRANVAPAGKGKLPPPPLSSQWRVFPSTRAIRENTRRQVRKLPEVLRKKEIERVNNLKRKNMILKDVYNRNLQRKVLRGQVDLSNSVRVIQD